MNIIAIMGPHGVFYKDEPIKELESARRDNGIGAVLQHIHFIAHANRQRTARTTFTDNRTNYRYAEARHFTQVACNGFRLTTLFCAHARISPRGVDKGDDRHLKAFSQRRTDA